jgi:putative transposase
MKTTSPWLGGSNDSSKSLVSIQTEMEVVKLLPLGLSAVGIDLGVTNFSTFSDGTFLKPKNSFKKHEQRTKKYQRRISRQVKGSKNYLKTKKKLQKVSATIADVRKDFLHKASTEIANRHSLVVIEDLKVKNMIEKGKHKRGLIDILTHEETG